MKATVIGILSGISAALLTWVLLSQRPSVPVVREIPVYREGYQPGLTASFLASTKPKDASKPLGKILPRVKCDEMPLEKFIAWIAQETGANFYVEWHQMAGGAAAGPDSPVTLDLRNVSAATALQLALDQSFRVGGPLGFAWVDNVVKVTVRSRLERARFIRVYDVRDLIEDAAKVGQRWRHKANDQPPADSNDRFAIPDFTKDPEHDAAEMLRDILLKCVEYNPDGESCEINYFAGRMVVGDTISNHELIAAMLAALRAKGE